MPGIKELSDQMRQLEEQLVSCMKCGMCQSVCPLFEQTHKESDVARGKIALLESLMNQMFENPDGVNKRLNKCLLCGSCAANCPSGVNVTQIFIEARSIITGYMKLPLLKKIVFKKMLAQPKVFDWIISMSSKIQKFFVTDQHSYTQTSRIKLLSPLLKNRRIMPIADLSFKKTIDGLIKDSQTTGPKIAVFTGCLIDKIFPQVGTATVKSLLHHNAQVFVPDKQGCCGIPALAAGDKETFLTLVKHNMDLFLTQDFDYLVTACATCTSTLKKLWPSMVGNEEETLLNQIKSVSEKTMDISQYLVDVAGLKLQEKTSDQNKKIVTYHDPCHLAKSLGIRKQPRDIISGCQNYVLEEMKDSDKCCGMGGSFNLYHYDISAKIGNIKRENIEETNCHTVATSCPACMIQISDMLSNDASNIYIKHPIELYAEGLD